MITIILCIIGWLLCAGYSMYLFAKNFDELLLVWVIASLWLAPIALATALILSDASPLRRKLWVRK